MNYATFVQGQEPDFDGAREPMRALRDLIVECEGMIGAAGRGADVLRRAQDAFAALRARSGDIRPAEDIAFAAMIEPGFGAKPVREALEITAGALQCLSRMVPDGEARIVHFTGRWQHHGSLSVGRIIDRADAALDIDNCARCEPAPIGAGSDAEAALYEARQDCVAAIVEAG
ncbi:MAG: hypothetical protein Q8L13_11565 [Bradyrhizobium sp.]|uniref:hypothetical protein n=1 Tax=Bradyrhizobium sp. TaxID=376 RepID=UPI00272F3A9D|nr:hypothetical protein [Bradyrhizobium sp.]MDP1866962.1 hypothetical protein [Bradyrhizobium sp.]